MTIFGWVSRRRKGVPNSGWSRSEGWEVGMSLEKLNKGHCGWSCRQMLRVGV